MSDNLPLSVNRKQFHFLLNQFLAEHRLQDKWFLTSSNYKLSDGNRKTTYNRYNVNGDENYSDFLYKCIDIYVGETIERDWGYYDKTIRGFFRFIPSGGCDGHEWYSFWEDYSKLWEKITYNVKYKKDGQNN